MCDATATPPPPAALHRRGLMRAVVAIAGVGLAVRAVSGGAAQAADVYHPFTGYPVTQTWAEHRANGSLGGIDFAMAVGTALPAAGAGTITNIPDNGTGGHTVTITHADGWKTQYMHLSSFSCADGESVAQGATVGLSGGAAGAPGSGSSTGPHVHWHMTSPGGTRTDPLTQVGSGSGGGGLAKTTTSETGEPGPVFWSRVQNAMRIEEGYDGPIDGVPGTNTYAALQRYLAAHHGYTGPADGDLGTNSYVALQRLAAAHGYTGPVDGAMGPNSWRGVARWVNADAYD
ncbi:M23 family metallopeptidase [Nocardioides plantarum]|uniref:Peptidoglycan DD-metalloendopeptidase family protein n=1 Tax=Nocardioides plantarum TaxID=29299 RepID=A0ABV5K6Y0_9ACTN|nr:M23 family metallopeptidase [Nocardioides plantarum]